MDKKERLDQIIKEAENNRTSITKERSSIVKDFLIIYIDSEFIAFQLEYLREVFDLANKNDIVPIPFTPDYILGIINIRGEIIPVISILKILGIEKNDISGNIYNKIAVLDEKFKIAFPFTELIDLKTVELKEIKAIKNASKKDKDQFLTQEFYYENKSVSIIDLIKIYSSEYLT